MGRVTAQEHTVKRVTVDLDLSVLEKAQKILSTRSVQDTVNAALREVNRRAKLSRVAAIIARGELDVVTPHELQALRQPTS